MNLLKKIFIRIRNGLNKIFKHKEIESINEFEMAKKYTSTIWTRADALKVNLDATNQLPPIEGDFPVLDDKLFIWDTMPLKTLDGDIVSVNGWNVIFTLTAWREPEKFLNKVGEYNITEDWNDRHGRARICYWYSKDGKSWIFGGRLMKEGVSPTTREWAGTPILLDDAGNIDFYYTCVTPGATIAKVNGYISTDDNGVYLSGFDTVQELFSADGSYYQTEEQNPYFNFRDPSPFTDPKSGKLYMVFEGNVAGDRGSHIVGDKELGDVPKSHLEVGGARYQTGCLGIAAALDTEGTRWKILPPLITATGVNDQLERPHFIFQDGKYYLFTISHKYTYADGLTGPDGVYGFVSDKLFGPYTPLNTSGLVLGNPEAQPYQTYSHYVMPNGLVTSFIDSVQFKKPNTDGISYRIGGTLAPTAQIKLKGNSTYYIDSLDFGYIPATKDVVLVEF